MLNTMVSFVLINFKKNRNEVVVAERIKAGSFDKFPSKLH